MKMHLYGLLAESPIHPGAGQSFGFVDLPVAREAATDYPVIVGSSVKGALLGAGRDREMKPAELRYLFGSAEANDGDGGGAGGLLVSDARLLLLPIRSLTSRFMWVTCPHLIERFLRDCRRSGVSVPESGFDLDAIGKDDGDSPLYLGASGKELFLEERQFTYSAVLPPKLTEILGPLIRHAETRRRLDDQLVVVSDDSFAWFARFGLSVNARNVLDDKTKTSKNLWYEETLPPDSLFYLLLAERRSGAIEKLQPLFDDRPYLQVGGNETLGHGWFAVSEPLMGGQ